MIPFPEKCHRFPRTVVPLFLFILMAGRGNALVDSSTFIGPDPSAPVTLQPNDRILILAPHPDDDILCCAGLLQEAVSRRIPLRVVYLTYGDNYEWAFMAYKKHPVLEPRALRAMGLLRHDEAVAGQAALGVSTAALTFLGYPDFGTMKIWTSHWGASPPYKSMLTRVTKVPYANARRPNTPYRGEEIVRDFREIIFEFRPTKIFLSHPADQHPDHRSLPLFVEVALWDLKNTIEPPTLYPYCPVPRLGYILGAPFWPDSRSDEGSCLPVAGVYDGPRRPRPRRGMRAIVTDEQRRSRTEAGLPSTLYSPR